MQSASFGGGCFWCIEAVVQELKGIEKVKSGYMGGAAPGKPTYREVCSGRTGHAEIVQISFDSNTISFHDLLSVFMTSHDPTLTIKQGETYGSQYRSVIYYHNESQRVIAEKVIYEMEQCYKNSITTELCPLKTFYEAESYHQNYYLHNRDQAFCSAVITPKLAKLRKRHSDKLKNA